MNDIFSSTLGSQISYINDNLNSVILNYKDFESVSDFIKMLNEKISLLKDNFHVRQTIKCIRKIGILKSLVDDEHHAKSLHKILKVAVSSIGNVGGENFVYASKALRKLQKFDHEMYCRAHALWISKQKYPVEILYEWELLKVAPHLTYLKLNHVRRSQYESYENSEDLIGEALEKSKKLEHVIIKNSAFTGVAFSRFKNTQRLKEISIKGCKDFNHNLPENLPNLERLSIRECPNFKMQGLSTSTHLQILRFQPHLIAEMNFSIEEKKELLTQLLDKEKNSDVIENAFRVLKISEDDLLKHFPYCYLSRIESRIANKQLLDIEIYEVLLTLKAQENYLDYLVEIMENFPLLSSQLLQNREELVTYMATVVEKLSIKSRLALLPFLPPDEIKSTLEKVPAQEKEEWLTVCQEVKLTFEFLRIIPFKTLAAVAETPLTYYCHALDMDESRTACIIPQFNQTKFKEFLKENPNANAHLNILGFATTEQKKFYLREKIFKHFFPANGWLNMLEMYQENLTRFCENPSKEVYDSFKDKWILEMSPFEDYKIFLSKLMQIMHTQSFFPALLDNEKTNIQEKEEELANMHSIILNVLPKKIEKFKEAPEEFLDGLTQEIMTNPYQDEHGNTLDKSSWDKCTNNPYTRQEKNIKPNYDLKKQIDEFLKKDQSLTDKGLFHFIKSLKI